MLFENNRMLGAIGCNWCENFYRINVWYLNCLWWRFWSCMDWLN